MFLIFHWPSVVHRWLSLTQGGQAAEYTQPWWSLGHVALGVRVEFAATHGGGGTCQWWHLESEAALANLRWFVGMVSAVAKEPARAGQRLTRRAGL